MTQLLVSVRDAQEAGLAIAGGAAAIDVKEPDGGALGAADSIVWQRVAAEVGKRVPLSAALGELRDVAPFSAAALAQFQYAKVGLSGCRGDFAWRSRWRTLQNQLPSTIELVAVIYADHMRARSPHPRDVLSAAVDLGLKALLIDTFDKQHGNLLAHQTLDQLQALCAVARKNQMLIVLGGSLDLAAAREVLPLAADWIAVRTAVCQAGRTGRVDQHRVQELAEALGSGRQ